MQSQGGKSQGQAQGRSQAQAAQGTAAATAAGPHPLRRLCGADGMSNRTFCWDRMDLPDPDVQIPYYAPSSLAEACGRVAYRGSDPVMFDGPDAPACVNRTASSILQHMDEARDGYADPRAYKRKTRHLAPLSATTAAQRHARRTEVISGVTLNRAGHADLDAVHAAGARGEGPIVLPKGRVVGGRSEFAEAMAHYAGLAAAV
jgi:hypothetical protein